MHSFSNLHSFHTLVVNKLVVNKLVVKKRLLFGCASVVVGASVYALAIRGPFQPVVAAYCWKQHDLEKVILTSASDNVNHFERIIKHIALQKEMLPTVPSILLPYASEITFNETVLFSCMLKSQNRQQLFEVFEKHLGSVDWSQVNRWQNMLINALNSWNDEKRG